MKEIALCLSNVCAPRFFGGIRWRGCGALIFWPDGGAVVHIIGKIREEFG